MFYQFQNYKINPCNAESLTRSGIPVCGTVVERPAMRGGRTVLRLCLKELKIRYYIGVTKNLENRFTEHNSGRVKSTKHRIPFELVYKEDFLAFIEARRREIEIKKMKGGIQFKSLLISKTLRG